MARFIFLINSPLHNMQYSSVSKNVVKSDKLSECILC